MEKCVCFLFDLVWPSDEGIAITKVQTQPWWYVDLLDHHQIYFVAINNPGIMRKKPGICWRPHHPHSWLLMVIPGITITCKLFIAPPLGHAKIAFGLGFPPRGNL